MTKETTDAIALPDPRSNRPVTITHRLEYALMRSLLAFFRLIGVDAASAIAGRFMRFIGPKLRSVSRRAHTNLRAAYPEWSEREIKDTTKSVWENLGRTTAEFAHLKQFAKTDAPSRVAIADIEKLQTIKRRGAPVIFVSAHLANWEIMSIVLHQLGIDYGVVYRAANNPLIDKLIIDLRAQVMSRRQIPKGKRGGRDLIEAISNGRSLAMLVDQKLNDGIEAQFFGAPAMTPPAAARLSLKYNAPIIPVSIVRRKGSAYFDMFVRDDICFTPTGDTTADVLSLTQKVNDTIEQEIRQNPDQWLWLHRRWKRPYKKNA